MYNMRPVFSTFLGPGATQLAPEGRSKAGSLTTPPNRPAPPDFWWVCGELALGRRGLGVATDPPRFPVVGLRGSQGRSALPDPHTIERPDMALLGPVVAVRSVPLLHLNGRNG